MARTTLDRQQRLLKKVEKSSDLQKAARQLALLALIHEDRPLNPREREELRRGMAIAGHALGWSETLATNPESGGEFALDVMSLTAIGIELLGADLAEERARKETEMDRLNDAAESARKMAADPNATYPTEIKYHYTARDPYQGLVTKTGTSTVSNSNEAIGAADSLQKSIEGRTKLADLMVLDLDERRKRLHAMTGRLPDFVKSLRGLLDEVVANLS